MEGFVGFGTGVANKTAVTLRRLEGSPLPKTELHRRLDVHVIELHVPELSCELAGYRFDPR